MPPHPPAKPSSAGAGAGAGAAVADVAAVPAPGAAPAPAPPAADLPPSMPLITQSNDNTVKLHDDAITAVLQSFLSTLVSVVVVLGGARTGKSSLLNVLFGRPLFATADGVVPCTKGADISTHAPRAAALTDPDAADDAADDGSGPRVLVVDVEGQGDRSAAYDTRMSAPILLTGRVVILNIKGQPTRSLLDNLAIVLAVQDHLTDGDGTRSFLDATRAAGRQPLGCLIIRCCDVNTTGEAAEAAVKAYIFDDEPLAEGTAHDEADTVRHRNATRQRVRDMFSSVSVFLTPYPFRNPADAGRVPLTADTASPAFMDAVHRMRTAIARMVLQPSSFQGVPLTGAMMAAGLRAAIDDLNSDSGKIVPSTIFEYMRREEEANVKQACRERLDGAAAAVSHTVADDDTVLLSTPQYTKTLLRELTHAADEARAKDVPAHLQDDMREEVAAISADVEAAHVADHAGRVTAFKAATETTLRQALDEVKGQDVLAASTTAVAVQAVQTNLAHVQKVVADAEGKVQRVDKHYVVDATMVGATAAGGRVAAAAVVACGKLTPTLADLLPWETMVAMATGEGYGSFVVDVRTRIAGRRTELEEAERHRRAREAAETTAASAQQNAAEARKQAQHEEERRKDAEKAAAAAQQAAQAAQAAARAAADAADSGSSCAIM